MAVDSVGISNLYDVLVGKLQATLTEEYDAGRLRNDQYAQVISNALVSAIQTSVQAVQNQPNIDTQIALSTKQGLQVDAQTATIASEKAIKEAQSAKDLLIKDTQIAQSTAQTAAITSEKTIKEAQSASDLLVKTAQKALIEKQQATEDKKALQVVRQTTYYDDQLRIKEGELLSNVVGMYGAGGTTLPSGLETAMLNAINAITS